MLTSAIIHHVRKVILMILMFYNCRIDVWKKVNACHNIFDIKKAISMKNKQGKTKT